MPLSLLAGRTVVFTILEHPILFLVCCLFQRQDEEEAMLIEMEKDSAVTATNIDDDIMVIMLQCSPFITLCLWSIGMDCVISELCL